MTVAAVRQILLEHFRIADNRKQNIIEIMCNSASQSTYGLHFLGLAKFIFKHLLFGDIDDDAP
jgi:hypothetical protein